MICFVLWVRMGAPEVFEGVGASVSRSLLNLYPLPRIRLLQSWKHSGDNQKESPICVDRTVPERIWRNQRIGSKSTRAGNARHEGPFSTMKLLLFKVVFLCAQLIVYKPNVRVPCAKLRAGTIRFCWHLELFIPVLPPTLDQNRGSARLHWRPTGLFVLLMSTVDRDRSKKQNFHPSDKSNSLQAEHDTQTEHFVQSGVMTSSAWIQSTKAIICVQATRHSCCTTTTMTQFSCFRRMWRHNFMKISAIDQGS